MENLIKIKDLSFSYFESTKDILKSVNMEIKQGEFIVLCGKSGCGKSTLLRQLKPNMTPAGNKKGEIYFCDTLIEELSHEKQAMNIGFVSQSVENQIVTDKVWHELAFGLESLGYDNQTIRLRVAEMASFFGIQTWFHKDINELSGGQKQILNLASIMVMKPKIMILDEPTSQLDPIASSEFLSIIAKINRELSTTIILTEHKLEEVFQYATKVCVIEQGKIISTGTPKEIAYYLKENKNAMFKAMPTAMRIWSEIETQFLENDCPITTNEGRTWLYTKKDKLRINTKVFTQPVEKKIAIKAENLWFRYEKDSDDIVKGVNLEVCKGEFLAILGGNGAGKTTTLKILANIKKAQKGTVQINGSFCVLPQNPQSIFVKKTVCEDLFETFANKKIDKTTKEALVTKYVNLCEIENLLNSHPYDLSGGEQQRVALCKVLLNQPEILFLDEPTKGLDAEFKEKFSKILNSIEDLTVVMISHDIEFCAKNASQSALFFDGNIIVKTNTHDFFKNNSFYTTCANRMSSGMDINVVTDDDLLYCLGKKPEIKPVIARKPIETIKQDLKEKLPKNRKILATILAVLSIIIASNIITTSDMAQFIDGNGISNLGMQNLNKNAVLILLLIFFTIVTSKKSSKQYTHQKSEKLNHRTIIALIIIILAVPLTLYVGTKIFNNQKYYFISMLVLMECMIPFFIVFENKKPQTREIVIIAVLCALAVSSRTALFMFPQFKPVIALCIISGVAFGGETGFLVGAISMFVSNMLFSQGPWTPWQMFAMGLIGFLSGFLFKKGFLKREKISICCFGLISSILIYGGIMNSSYAFMYTKTITVDIFFAYFISGFPMDLMQGVATALYLWYLSDIMLEKLDRIKIKYDLI